MMVCEGMRWMNGLVDCAYLARYVLGRVFEEAYANIKFIIIQQTLIIKVNIISRYYRSSVLITLIRNSYDIGKIKSKRIIV